MYEKSFIELVPRSEGFVLFTNVVKIILALIKKKIGGATTFSIMTFSIMTPSIKGYLRHSAYTTVSMIQLNNILPLC
jgi:hypothetical protein